MLVGWAEGWAEGRLLGCLRSDESVEKERKGVKSVVKGGNNERRRWVGG